MSRVNSNSKSPYEPVIGFSRGVRIGRMVAISGTAPLNEDGTTAFQGDPYHQTKRCLEIIEKTAKNLGACLEDAIRTRVYLKNTKDWKLVGKAHGEYFKGIQPACTFVEISNLLQEDWLVEIEADFVLDD